jgi:hypothetical protein
MRTAAMVVPSTGNPERKMKHYLQNRLLAIAIASILALGLTTTTTVPAAFATDDKDDDHKDKDDKKDDKKRKFIHEVKECFKEEADHDKKFSDDVKDCIKDEIDKFFNDHDKDDKRHDDD